MLVLTRKKDETVVIGDCAYITVLGCRNGKVKLGISAPDHVTIHRLEAHERIEKGERRDH